MKKTKIKIPKEWVDQVNLVGIFRGMFINFPLLYFAKNSSTPVIYQQS